MSGAGSRTARALRLGLFALGGLFLIGAAVVSVFGGRLFAHTERAVMHFDGSIYGLQVGAPVVFRGVQLGSVVSIGVVHDPRQGGFSIPVLAELDRAKIRDLRGKTTAGDPALALPALVARGLRAQLSTQSLLTGQLYINLDLQTDAPAPPAPPGSSVADAVEIPTRANRLQTLQAQLEGFDLARVLSDVSSISAGLRQLLGGPELGQTLEELRGAAGALQRLSLQLERRAGPLADAAQATLREGQRAAGGLASAADRGAQAAERVGLAAERLGAAAGRAEQLLQPGSPMLGSLQRAAEELGTSAAALRSTATNGGATLQELERTLQDVARAARSVRELADALERQPDALLRGRAVTPP